MSDTPIEEIQEEPAVVAAQAEASEAADTTIEEADATIESEPEEGEEEQDEEQQDVA